ncbi:hypothetical protein OTK49_21145 [Vibrio coralliirubri]|uniref:hypothetical protein n=1 Tax=Vibrio coralliirubri TaxID=1516159 RepID=UPI002284EDD8|nr:hypothetical protein [Vibrio coralliirubri]MCY9865027.1 hypothetical protein [Vibrio coralliirubri]
MRLFHYTTQARLESILKDGVLLPTNEFKTAPSPTGKRIKAPIWLTANETMEMGAIKPVMHNGECVMLSIDEFTQYFGLYRIEVKPSNKTLSYNRLTRAMGLPSNEAKSQEDVAIKHGSKPQTEWYGIVGTLKVDKFIGIERYNNGTWESVKYSTTPQE